MSASADAFSTSADAPPDATEVSDRLTPGGIDLLVRSPATARPRLLVVHVLRAFPSEHVVAQLTQLQSADEVYEVVVTDGDEHLKCFLEPTRLASLGEVARGVVIDVMQARLVLFEEKKTAAH